MVLQIGVDSKRLQVHENLYRGSHSPGCLIGLDPPDQVLVPLFQQFRNGISLT